MQGMLHFQIFIILFYLEDRSWIMKASKEILSMSDIDLSLLQGKADEAEDDSLIRKNSYERYDEYYALEAGQEIVQCIYKLPDISVSEFYRRSVGRAERIIPILIRIRLCLRSKFCIFDQR